MGRPGDPMREDDDLLRRCARGDGAAYQQLVERLEKPLINFLLRFTGERAAAEDLFQETFVRVIRTLGEFKPEASLSTWVYTIARNLALDHLKAKRRHRETPLDAEASRDGGKVIYFKDVLRSGTPEPADRAEAFDEERRATAALAHLSPLKREALVLRLYSGLPYDEIARLQGSPVGTVKFRIHEAFQDLAKILGARGGSSAAQGG